MGPSAVPLDQGGPDGKARTRETVRVDAIGRRDALAVTLVGGGIDHAAAYKPDGVGPVPIAAGLVLVLLLGGAAVLLVLRAPADVDDAAARAVLGSAGAGPDGPDPGHRPVDGDPGPGPAGPAGPGAPDHDSGEADRAQ